MDVTVSPSKLFGTFNLPPSKSHSIRAIVLASFADGDSVLHNVLASEDTETALKIFSRLGVVFHKTNVTDCSYSLRVLVPECGLRERVQSLKPEAQIDCGNSGTLLYFLSVIFGFFENGTFTFTGDASLSQRPLEPILEIFRKRGVPYTAAGNRLPLTITGKKQTAPLSLELDGTFSQSISGLLLACAIFSVDLDLRLKHFGEAPYVLMTENWLQSCGFHSISCSIEKKRIQFKAPEKSSRFGIPALHTSIPPDWSAAAFPILAAIGTGSMLTINAAPDTTQGDFTVTDILKRLGVNFTLTNGFLVLQPPYNLTAIDIDIEKTPDLLPVVCALCSLAKGRSVISRVKIARYKETDRVAATVRELAKCGVNISEGDNTVTVSGGNQSLGANALLQSYHDHRMAMMLISYALGFETSAVVADAGCYAISFPTFLTELKKCGADIAVKKH